MTATEPRIERADLRILTGDRLDTYLRAIGEQVTGAIARAESETARFAHQTFADLLERERALLEQHRLTGIEPSLAFDGNGLPSADSLRADLAQYRNGWLADGPAPAVAGIHTPVEEKDWHARKQRDRIAREELRVAVGRGPRDGLELRVTQSAYRDCIDEIGQTVPFYLREAITEYRVAFGELFWSHRSTHHRAEPNGDDALISMRMKNNDASIARMKKYDDITIKYELRRSHLTTRRVGIFRRRYIPNQVETMLTHTQDTRQKITRTILGEIEGLYGLCENYSEIIAATKRLDEKNLENVTQCLVRPGRPWCTITQTRPETYVGYGTSISYGAVSITIPGAHIENDEHYRMIKQRFSAKSINP